MRASSDENSHHSIAVELQLVFLSEYMRYSELNRKSHRFVRVGVVVIIICESWGMDEVGTWIAKNTAGSCGSD